MNVDEVSDAGSIACEKTAATVMALNPTILAQLPVKSRWSEVVIERAAILRQAGSDMRMMMLYADQAQSALTGPFFSPACGEIAGV